MRDMHTLTRPIRDVGVRATPSASRPRSGRRGLCRPDQCGEGPRRGHRRPRCRHHGAPVELRIAGVVEDEAYWFSCQQLIDEARTTNPRFEAVYLGHLDYHHTDELFARVRHRDDPVALARAARRGRARGDVGGRRRHRITSRRARRHRRPRSQRPPGRCRVTSPRSPPPSPPSWTGPTSPPTRTTSAPRRGTHRERRPPHPRARPSRREPRHHRAPHPRHDLIRRCCTLCHRTSPRGRRR